jgi:hypothetical protein
MHCNADSKYLVTVPYARKINVKIFYFVSAFAPECATEEQTERGRGQQLERGPPEEEGPTASKPSNRCGAEPESEFRNLQ